LQKEPAACGKFSERTCWRWKIFRSSPLQAENFQKEPATGENFQSAAGENFQKEPATGRKFSEGAH